MIPRICLVVAILLLASSTFAQVSLPSSNSSTTTHPNTTSTSIEAILDAQVELGRISESRADERIKQLQAFIQKSPNSPLVASAKESLLRARASLAETLLKQQRLEPALEQLQQAFKDAPQPISERVFANLIWVLPTTVMAHGYRTEAIELMRTFEPSFAQQPSRLAQIAIFYFNAEAGVDAMRVLNRAIELEPKENRYFNSLATAYLLQLRLKDAKAAFQQAINLDNKHPLAYSGLASLYRAEGSLDDAIALYKKQLEVSPEHDTAHGGLAIAYLLAKQDALAANELGQQFAISPRDFQLFTQLAYLAASRKNYPQARRWADLAINLAPNYVWARIAMANILLEQQDFSSAEQLLSDSIARGNAFPTLYFELTHTLLMAEDYEGAFEQFERFLNINAEGEFESKVGADVNRSRSLKILLEKERKAALALPDSITSDDHYRLAESFLRFKYYLSKLRTNEKNEAETNNRRQKMEIQVKLLEHLTPFLALADERRPFRQLWAAEQLYNNDIALERAAELSSAALKDAELATKGEGTIRDALDLDKERRLKVFSGRAYHLLGQIRFKQGQLDEASKALKLAIENFGEGAAQRVALAHLAAVTAALGDENQALALYIKSYNSRDENAAVQKLVIESLYRKLHGSLAGLELR